ncbi:MAG: glutamate-cysteine ligase family protein [Gemmatimonadota bacterium]
MGEKDVHLAVDQEQLRVFTQHLLRDVQALEQMLDGGVIESGIRRVGVEQEMFLVDKMWRPAPIAVEFLEAHGDDRVVSEIGRFNLEANLSPRVFGDDCLSEIEAELREVLDGIHETARSFDADLVLTGILPTLRKSDLSMDNMVPEARYYALNEALTKLRGGPYDLRITGTDELAVTHESVMLEAANASFQVHFQVGPEEFARLYNIALAATGPVLAAAVNSPLMFGKRLWHETRIAVFQQSVDTRATLSEVREIAPRVSFGRSWVDTSVLEIFREDIARFKVILGRDVEEDPFEALGEGRPPKLQALQLHNSTVYRWNRACYGIGGGRAHLRIESRVLPSGPSVQDEVANAALWFGLMSGLAEEYKDIRSAIEFDTVRTNFLAAARQGLDAQLTWLDGRTMTAQSLVREHLLPLAREGLAASGISATDSDRYLGIVEDRVQARMSGSQWLLSSLTEMGGQGTSEERTSALVAATVSRQRTGEPVHNWKIGELEEAGGWKPSFLRVEQYMATDLLTANEDEPIELVANLMDWHKVHHIPVEDNQHRLVGLVSQRPLLRFLANTKNPDNRPIPVREVMERDLITVDRSTSTMDAIELMRKHGISCLPVVQDGQLIGIVTEHDFMKIAGQLLEEMLTE